MSRSQIGVISFPGSNGDWDAYHALVDSLGVPARMIDHRERHLSDVAALVIPGGFSYGDYLRCGAIARFSPIMDSVRTFAVGGGPILGICNGFQILTEAHLLPGALLRNQRLRFQCSWTHIRVEQESLPWTSGCDEGEVLRLPIAHGDGCYFADSETLNRMEHGGQVIARYCDASGRVASETNVNSSVHGIAAVANEAKTVVGMMPHPERATDRLLGGHDGLRLFRGLLDYLSVAA